MGRDEYSQSSLLSPLVGRPVSRYTNLPKNTTTLRNLTESRAKPNNRLHYSTYPTMQTEYQASYSQLTNLDFYSPIITILGGNPYAHLRNTKFVDPGIILDETSTLVSNVSTVDDNAFGTFKITYVATDGINPDTTSVRVVKVGEYPTATITGDNPYTLERFQHYVDAGIVPDANSSVISTTSSLNNTAVGTYTINYTVANNVFSSFYSRIVNVVDTTPPVITILGDNPYTLERFDPYVDPGATVDIGSVLTTDTSNTQNTSIGSFVVVYNATDGNTAHDVVQTRTVNVVDTVPPVITILGDNPYTLERFDPYVDPGATVDRGSILTTDLTAVSNILAHGSSFDVTYTATDGNTSHDVTQTRTVNVLDRKPPQITLLGDNPYLMQPAIDFRTVDPLFEVDLGTSVTIDYSNVVDTHTSTFTVVYTASDGVHPDVIKTRQVAINDNQSPIVTLNGASIITLERYDPYLDEGVTLDPGSVLVSTTSTLDNTVVGSYTITYEATDYINPNTTNVRTINVVDTTPPVVTLNGSSSVILERYDVFADIDDGVDIEAPGTLLSLDISQLDNTTQGTYTVTYIAVDDHNNTTNITREVVVRDTVPPVVTLNNASTNYTMERNGVWADIDPGVTLDAGSELIGVNVDNTAVGVVTVQYVVTDGTFTTYTPRNINIVDTTPPTGSIANPTYQLERFGTYTEYSVENLDIGTYLAGTDTSNVDSTLVHGSTFDVVYDLADDSQTNTFLIRTVTVVDTIPPTGTVNNPSFTLERFGIYNDPVPGVINLDQGSYIAGVDLSNVDNTISHGSTFDVVYDLGDDANNTFVIRTVTVNDTTPPTGSISNPTYQLERFGTYTDYSVENLDAGTYLAATDTSNVDNTLSHGSTFDVIYDLGDDVTNTYLIRTVTVVDTTPPYGTLNNPSLLTLERFDEYNDPVPGVINIDQGSYIAHTDLSNVDNTIAHGSSFDVVYDIGDGVSNTYLIRTINVVDTTPPTGSIANPSYQLERFDTYVEYSVENLDAGTYLAATDTSNVDNTLSHGSSFDVIYDLGDDVTNTYLTRTVTVVDTTAPVASLANPTYQLERYDIYTEHGVTGLDIGSYLVSTDFSNVTNTSTGVSSFDVVYDIGDGVSNTTLIRTVSVVDPVLNETSNLILSNGGVNDVFGDTCSMTNDGSVVVVGAKGGQKVGVYSNVNGTWSEIAILTTTDGTSYYATSVSISGDGSTIAVGSREGSLVGAAVYIYEKPTNGWVTTSAYTAKLTGAMSSESGGASVGLSEDGSILATGATSYKPPNTAQSFSGAVYVYERSGSNWSSTSTHTALLTGSDVVKSDTLGDVVVISRDGTVIVAGAPLDDSNDPRPGGAVYIYEKPVNGSWTTATETHKIMASDKARYDRFGESVCISEDKTFIAVGAPQDDDGASGSGSAYIFEKSVSGWSQQAKINASDSSTNGNFGWSIATNYNGNTLFVGSTGATGAGSGFYYGAVYVYKKPSGGWTNTNGHGVRIQPSETVASDQFGYSVAASYSGTRIVAGATGHDTNGDSARGKAYIFDADYFI